MPSELTKSVRTALSAFVSSREADGGEITSDILRVIKEESSNLLERQQILDAFEADPFELCKDDASLYKQFQRAKSMINVLSCSRCTTRDGYCKIDAVVEMRKDELMKDVEESVRLTFSYEREPIHHGSNLDDINLSSSRIGDDHTVDMDSDESTGEGFNCEMMSRAKSDKTSTTCPNVNRTHITYKIEMSRDHGMNERILTVEIFAPGDSPSPEKAVPLDDGEEEIWEEYDDEGNQKEVLQHMEEDNTSTRSGKDKQLHETDEKSVTRDQYGAYVDSEVLMKFLRWSNLKLDDSSSVFFFLTFPFYEHEWDLVSFVLDATFGEDGESTEDDSIDKSVHQ